MSDRNTAEIIERGMNCLLENLGAVDMELFISVMIRERFDYTKWRRTFFGDATVKEINDAAAMYAEEHPFQPGKTLQNV